MKDYWIQAYKEFFYLGLFGVFLDSVFLISWVLDAEWIRTFESQAGKIGILSILLFFAATIFWLALGLSFKKKKIWAIKLGYGVIGVLLVTSIISLNLITVLIFSYFLWVIRKAQKQSTITNFGE